MRRIAGIGWAALLGLGCPADSDPAQTATDSTTNDTPTTSVNETDPQPSTTAVDGSSSSGEPGCTANPDTMADCVEEAPYVEDVTFVAQSRSPGEPGWQIIQDFLIQRLMGLGYEIELHEYETGINVLGRLRGTSTQGDVIISAHYDSVPNCAGADDNASGVAGALEAARVLSMGTYENDLVIAFWDQEEVGLIGASLYVADAVERGDTVIANYNLEMIGYTDTAPQAQSIPAGFDAVFPEAYAEVEENDFRGDFITIVADDLIVDGALALEAQADRLGLPAIRLELGSDLKNSPLLSDLRRSDHAPFWGADFPAMMITDTSEFRYPDYHCDPAPDTVDKLDHAFSRQVIAATTGAAATSLVMVSN